MPLRALPPLTMKPEELHEPPALPVLPPPLLLSKAANQTRRDIPQP